MIYVETNGYIAIPQEAISSLDSLPLSVYMGLIYIKSKGHDEAPLKLIAHYGRIKSLQTLYKAMNTLEENGWAKFERGKKGFTKFEVYTEQQLPEVEQYRRLKDGTVVREETYQLMKERGLLTGVTKRR